MAQSTPSSFAWLQESTAALAPPEIQAIKQLIALLDKIVKTRRTYGPKNPVAQKFCQQFYHDRTIQLTTHGVLQFMGQRAELIYKGIPVYQSTSSNENLAFQLHADGIRELSFRQGLSQDDLAYFLEALWGTYYSDASHDDIVTRLWEKNLATISFVTAEEIVNAA